MSSKGLTSSLFSRTKALVLRELLLVGDTPVHLRELARRTGLDASGLRRELRKLAETGVVHAQPMGNQMGYNLNRSCPVYHELRMIVLKTSGLSDALRTVLAPLAAKIEKAYIYGSIASGTDTSDSDVDLMVIGEVSLREIVKAVSKVGRELGRVINPTVMRPDEYQKQLADSGSFVSQLESGPRIMLIGDENEP